jgi:hypothetical protein
VISKLTGEVVRGGYATFTAVEADARYLAYGSVVDDASNDPTLVLPQDIDNSGSAADLVVPAVASLPGAAGTMWRSQLDLVNTTSEPSSVTLEYVRADGSSVTSMAMELAPGAALHLDDVVGDLFGEHGKGWLRVSASGGGILATSRTFNDDANGTYGQLISAAPAMSAVGPSVTVLLPGLSSRDGLRTNLGLTSLAPETTSCTIRVFDNDGAAVGELPAELPPRGFVQIERALAGELGYIGDAWAEVSCSHPSAAFFAHASVIDEITGDPTTIPAIVINE